MRPRRRKAFEQADGQRDRFQEVQRRGIGWEDHQRRQSRVRVQYGSDLRFSDMEDLDEFDAPVQTYDGRATLQYSRPGRTRKETHRHMAAPSDYRRRSFSKEFHQQLSARPTAFRRRSLPREEHQQPYARHVGERAEFHSHGHHQQQRQRDFAVHENTGMEKHSFVSFYFTNVPGDISYISLRQGFEVCGMMEDVYLVKKRNVNGGVFGFVRYGKVKDVEKLLKALNNVWFGDCRVVAKVASFDRFGNKKHGVGVKGEGDIKKEFDLGREGDKRKMGRGIHIEGDNIKGNESVVGAEVIGRGKVVLEVVEGNNLKEGAVEDEQHGQKVQYVEDKKNQVFIPKYTSSVTDMPWASKGLVVSVLNGDAILVLQRRIFDAGFVHLVIILLSADKVFLRSLDDVDVSTMLSEAIEFFNKFFSTPVRWNKDTLVRERGAWVRIYGVPLHAWNYDFFKLCVCDCGRLMRVDDITLDRDRFDYARVLVSTSSLDIINSKANILVDGVLFEFKIIEEWGFAVGEDACLFDEAESQVDDRSDMPEDLDNGIGGGDVDELLNRLSKDWKKEDEVQHIAPSPVSATVKVPSISPTPAAPAQAEAPFLESATKSKLMQDIESEGNVDRQSRKFLIDDKKVVKRTSSCPPGRDRATSSGPWSLEWVNSHKSVSLGAASKPKNKVTVKTSGVQRVTKKKGGGYLRHSTLNLKRIARLSDSDRRDVLHALQRTTKQRKAGSGVSKAKVTSKVASSNCTSQTSINNDWNNWLVLHGNDKVMTEDVCEIGRTGGLNFSGDRNNMFDVLSGVGRKNREGGGNGVCI